jgi:hypothetical protein
VGGDHDCVRTGTSTRKVDDLAFRALVQAPYSSNDSNVGPNLMIREDCSELLGDVISAVHLAAVEAHHESVVGEACGVGRRVLPIPGFKD